MQITTTMSPAISTTALTAATADSGEMLQGDFMSLISQLLLTCGDLALDMSAVDALQSRLEEEGQELSAQMLAQLMTNPLISSLVSLQPQDPSLTATTGTPGKPDWSMHSPALSSQTPSPMTDKVLGEVLSHTVTGQQPRLEPDQSLLAQSRFNSLLMEAKGSATAVSQLESLEALDIDRLQEEIKAGKFSLMQQGAATGLQAAAIEAGAEQPQSAPLLEQVTEGITTNLTKGKTEFVVKLKPEGLGEITVKMAEIGSKISLTITTSSEQTGRMLSAELGALKEALRPYNADVQEVVSGTSQASYFFQEGNKGNLGGRQSFGRQQSRQGRAAPELMTEAVSLPTLQQSGALDLHI